MATIDDIKKDFAIFYDLVEKNRTDVIVEDLVRYSYINAENLHRFLTDYLNAEQDGMTIDEYYEKYEKELEELIENTYWEE